MTRKRRKKGDSKPKDEAAKTLRKRRPWLTLSFGLFAGLLGGLLGALFGWQGMVIFGVVGLIMGLLGGWVAASVGMWPRNKNTHYWSTRLLRKVRLDSDPYNDQLEVLDDNDVDTDD